MACGSKEAGLRPRVETASAPPYYLYVCVCVHAWSVHTHACGCVCEGQRSVSGFFHYHAPPYFLR